MRKSEIKVGGIYWAKVNGKVTKVKVDDIRESDTGDGQGKYWTAYDVTNLSTGRKTTFRSAAKFRSEVEPLTHKERAGYAPIVTESSPTNQSDPSVKVSISEVEELSHPEKTADQLRLEEREVRSTPNPRADQLNRIIKQQSEDYEIDEDGEEVEQRSDPTSNLLDILPATHATGVGQTSCTVSHTNQGVDKPEGKQNSDPTTQDGVVSEVGTVLAQTHQESNVSSGLLASALSDNQQERGTHLIVIARAGSGKTLTLVEGTKEVYGIGSEHTPSPQQEAVWEALKECEPPRSCTLTSFSNTIVDTLIERIPQVKGLAAKTQHSCGYYAVRKAFKITGAPDDKRVLMLTAELLGRNIFDLRKQEPVYLKAVKELVGYAKQNLLDPTTAGSSPDSQREYWNQQLDQLARFYDVEVFQPNRPDLREKVFEMVPRVLERCKDVNRDGYIDFNDMIWLPVVMGLPVWRNDLLLVDEAQDLNKCQLELAMMMGRRIVFCGDPRQSIYGFAGALSESMTQAEEKLSATPLGCRRLYLTVTRRCGKKIVEEAQRLVPDFEAHPDNPEGIVGEARFPIQKRTNSQGQRELYELKYEDTYLPLVQEGDMVLCRTNAALLKECFRHIKRGRKAFMVGRKISEGLVSLLDNLKEAGAYSIPSLITKVGEWLQKETEKENARPLPSESCLELLSDKAESLLIFAENANSVDDVKVKIESTFSDDKTRPGIKHSSIHRAKGLEADRVFYLRGEGCCGRPLDRMKQWERLQEENLEYVGITRAKEELTYVY